MPFDPMTASLDDLAKWTGGCQPGSPSHSAGMAELTRRQLMASIEATRAAKRNANYMLASVLVAGVAALASAIATANSVWYH
jgi:hypothetical protein